MGAISTHMPLNTRTTPPIHPSAIPTNAHLSSTFFLSPTSLTLNPPWAYLRPPPLAPAAVSVARTDLEPDTSDTRDDASPPKPPASLAPQPPPPAAALPPPPPTGSSAPGAVHELAGPTAPEGRRFDVNGMRGRTARLPGVPHVPKASVNPADVAGMLITDIGKDLGF